MAECTTCAFYNRQSGRCGAYDMPAEIARARPLLCGDAGADHALRAPPRGEGAIIVAGIIVAVLVAAAHVVGILT
jgi:hypothetical protein